MERKTKQVTITFPQKRQRDQQENVEPPKKINKPTYDDLTELYESFGPSDSDSGESDIESSDDDDIPLLLLDPKLTRTSSSITNKIRNLPKMNVRSSKRNITLDTDDLRKELDLSDSDSETLGLLYEKSDKAPKVRRNISSLIKDLSKRTEATLQREALHREIEKSLEDRENESSLDDLFSCIPNSDSLRLSKQRNYRGTDLQWVHRYSFSEWKQKDFQSLCDPQQFIEAAKESPILCKFIKAAPIKSPYQMAKILITSNCILSANLSLPDSVLSWMCKVGKFNLSSNLL